MNSAFSPSPSGLRAREGALGPYARAIRAHKLLVVLITLVTVAASIAWVALRAPQYEATSQVLVTALPEEDEDFLGLPLLRDSGDPTRTVQTAAALIDSPLAADVTAERLGGGWTGEEVRDAVEVNPAGESNILDITAEADESELAARVADEFARASLAERNRGITRQVRDEISQLRARRDALSDTSGIAAAELAGRLDRLESVLSKGDPTLSFARAATPPTSASGPGAVLLIPLSILAGLALGTGTAILLELLDRRIRDEDELGAVYPLPILVRVPALSRRQRRRPHEGPWFMPPVVREAFRTILAQLDAGGEARRTLMVTSPSTGDGKTTSAINLAVSIAAAGHTVILIDLDIRKPEIGLNLGIKTEQPLAALLGAALHRRFPELLVSAPQVPGLRVLATESGMADVALLDALNRLVPDMLREATELAEYVVVDTPPLGEVSDALRIAHAVDAIILAARPSNTYRRHLEITRDLLERAGRPPTGYLVVGSKGGVSSTYYSYGLAAARGEMPSKLPSVGERR